MRYRVLSDWHCFSTYEFGSIEDLEMEIVRAPKDEIVVYLGDNVDMKNVRKRDVSKAHEALVRMAGLVRSRGGIYIGGNHELDAIPTVTSARHEDTHFEHGDFAFWGAAKARAYRQKTPGAGILKRTLWSPALDEMRDVWGARMNDKVREHAERLVRVPEPPRRIVFGHKHPKTLMVERLVSGVKILVVPRGVTIL